MHASSQRIANAAGLVILLALFFVLLTLVAIGLNPERFSLETLIRIGITWLPALAYLRAIGAIRKIAIDLAKPESAMRQLPPGLAKVGASLAIGGVLSVGSGVFLMATESGAVGGFPALNLPGLVIAILGMLISGVSRLLERAIDLDEQNRKLKSELGEFV